MQAARHQVVHQVVAASDRREHVVDQRLLVRQRHRAVAEMGVTVAGHRAAFPKHVSAPLPKFVKHAALSGTNFGIWGTSTYIILVPLFDLKFRLELADDDVGTSNRRH